MCSELTENSDDASDDGEANQMQYKDIPSNESIYYTVYDAYILVPAQRRAPFQPKNYIVNIIIPKGVKSGAVGGKEGCKAKNFVSKQISSLFLSPAYLLSFDVFSTYMHIRFLSRSLLPTSSAHDAATVHQFYSLFADKYASIRCDLFLYGG